MHVCAVVLTCCTLVLLCAIEKPAEAAAIKKRAAAKKQSIVYIPERQAYFTSTPHSPDTHNTITPATVFDTTLVERLSHATVNIICKGRAGNAEHLSFGSGVVFNKNGRIITNAHVGVYGLLPTGTCVARSGNPAGNAYNIVPIYIPEQWIRKYAPHILEEHLAGTGESDYMIFEPAFPQTNATYIPLSTQRDTFATGDTLLASGYPAEFLGVEALGSQLFYNSSYVTAGEPYTFSQYTKDVYTFGNSILARGGISGGPIVDRNGTVAALMTNATREKTTQERSLRAVVVGYVYADIFKNTGVDIANQEVPTPLWGESILHTKTTLQALYP